MSFQNLPEFVHLQNGLFLARLTQVYTLVDSDVAPGADYAGMTAGTNIYSFIEQTKDPVTGLPIDANPGRQSYPVAPANPTSAFAIEVNNTLLTVPGDTPTGYTNPGPYAWMKQRETISSAVAYEFEVSSSSSPWGVVQIDGVTPYHVPDLDASGLAYFYPCKVIAGVGKGSFGWAEAANEPPNFSATYFGYFLGNSTQKPPDEIDPSKTSWPGFQLLWTVPFNYVTLASTGATSYGLLASEPNLILDALNIYFGPPNSSTTPELTPPVSQGVYTNLAVQYGGGSYGGATGSDGVGNMFVAGLCTNVGSGSSSQEPSLW